jgi:hypothetical protein
MDLPTKIVSRANPPNTFYGIEKQPYISEIHWNIGASPSLLSIELTNPHNVRVDLGTQPAPYALQLADDQGLATPLVTFSVDGGNVLGFAANDRYLYATNDPNLPPFGQSPDDLINVPDDAPAGGKIQLVRTLPGGAIVVCDEVALPDAVNGIISRQRDNNPANMGGWRVSVPIPFVEPDQGLQETLGKVNDMVIRPAVVPVHAATDDMGLESAYPTTGAMLLLMRHANSLTAAANATLGGSAAVLDNGHMPVFDTAQVAQGAFNGAQPMDGKTQLSIPWGQLVFDYFTALAFENQFNPLADPPLFTIPTNPGDMGDPDWPASPNGDGDGDGLVAHMDRGYAEYVAYLRANQPTVELGGVRVHGRININAAPWKVLDGLPLMHPRVMPIYKHLYSHAGPPPIPAIDTWKWSNVLPDPNGGFPMGFDSFTPTGDGAGLAGPTVEKLGVRRAKGIVAYRELRDFTNASVPWTTGNYNTLNGGARLRSEGPASGNFLALTTQRHTAGFLTVGELANVRSPGGVMSPFTDTLSQMDNGQTVMFGGAGAQNYLFAVAPLVALGDWVTVKGHTFTAYGVLTGQGDVEEVNRRAERFEMVFDRSNLLISDDPAERPEVIYKTREPLSEVNPN